MRSRTADGAFLPTRDPAFLSAFFLLRADRLRRALGDSVVLALEKLTGLGLTAISGERILAGLRQSSFAPPGD